MNTGRNQGIGIPEGKPQASGVLRAVAWGLLLLGALLSLTALIDADARVRFAYGYLWAFAFMWCVALGSLFFVGLHHACGAVWSVVVRRAAEMLAAPMWLLGLLFIPVILFALDNGRFHLFDWLDPAQVHGDHLLEGKRPYLNLPFFVTRAAVYFALWIAFARFFVGGSLRQDKGGGHAAATARMQALAGPFLLIFAITATFAAIDWLMSLSPRWFSSIFGVYVFSGMALTALAAVTLLAISFRRTNRLGDQDLTAGHLYNLGALQFAFTCFWAYIAFSQYMLIWYANMPEETFYLARRLQGGWLPVSIALALVRFVLPFLLLLSREAKMNVPVMAGVSMLVLAGQGLDLYWLVMPELHVASPVLGWQEAGPVLLLSGAFTMCLARFLGRNPPLAIGDPFLDQSRRFRLH